MCTIYNLYVNTVKSRQNIKTFGTQCVCKYKILFLGISAEMLILMPVTVAYSFAHSKPLYCAYDYFHHYCKRLGTSVILAFVISMHNRLGMPEQVLWGIPLGLVEDKHSDPSYILKCSSINPSIFEFPKNPI